MPFPVTSRYFLRFRNSDTGLTPTFTYFKRADTFANLSAPTITELSGGTYWFDWTFTTTSDPDVVFQVDGGVSIPTEEVRFISGGLSPRDRFLDEPVSQVHDDVWNDADDRAVGTKGDFVEHIGIDTDAVDASTVFGKLYKTRDVIMGGTGYGGTGENLFTARDRIMGGTGFGGTGVDIKTVEDTLGTPADSSSVDTIFGRGMLLKEVIRGDAPGGGGGNSVKEVYDRVGAPVGATISVDIAAIQTKLGSPAGASVSADIAAVKGDTAAIKLKTDNLPTDPADESVVLAAITTAQNNIKGAGNKDLTQVDTKLGSPVWGSVCGDISVVDGYVQNIKDDMGNPLTDTPSSITVVGKILAARDSVKGSQLLDISTIAGGAAFVPVTDTLHSIKGSVAGLTPPDNASIALILTEVNKIGAPGDSPSGSTLFAKIYNSRDAVMGTGGWDLTDVCGTGYDPASHSLKVIAGDLLLRALGMLHENSVLDCTQFNTDNNLIQARVRLYNSKTNSDAARDLAVANPGVVTTYDTGKLAEYAIRCSYTGTNMAVYEVSKEA